MNYFGDYGFDYNYEQGWDGNAGYTEHICQLKQVNKAEGEWEKPKVTVKVDKNKKLELKGEKLEKGRNQFEVLRRIEEEQEESLTEEEPEMRCQVCGPGIPWEVINEPKPGKKLVTNNKNNKRRCPGSRGGRSGMVRQRKRKAKRQDPLR